MTHDQAPIKNEESGTALVIGAGGGIGRAVVRRLTNRGFAVVGIGREESRMRECPEITDRRICDASNIDDVDSIVGDLVAG